MRRCLLHSPRRLCNHDHTVSLDMMLNMLRVGRMCLLTSALAFFLGTSPVAHAQTGDEVGTGIKGTVGLGLIGAELGLVVPALAGMRDTWPYIVFPSLGAVGGGLAGYFGIDQSDNSTLAVATLGVGMAAIIPSVVITLSATAYDPSDDKLPGDGTRTAPTPPAVTDESNAAAALRGRQRMARLDHSRHGGLSAPPATGLVHVHAVPRQEGFRLGAPAVTLQPDRTPKEQLQFGPAVTELHIPVITGSF